jgi:hypothetical protein
MPGDGYRTRDGGCFHGRDGNRVRPFKEEVESFTRPATTRRCGPASARFPVPRASVLSSSVEMAPAHPDPAAPFSSRCWRGHVCFVNVTFRTRQVPGPDQAERIVAHVLLEPHLQSRQGTSPAPTSFGQTSSCREELFGTYRSELFQRFWDLGVDLTERHALAEFLIDHQGATSLFGFAKRHREDPRIQRELNVALAYHAGAGNDKGTSLCLWAGGDPHVSACDLRYGRRCTHRLPNDQRDDDDEPFWSAIDHACRAGHVAILKRLKPDPALDDFDELYGWARDRYVVEYLMGIAPPKDENSVLQHHLWRIGWFENDWRAMDTLRSLFEAGLRWTSRSKEAAAGMRHILLKLREETFIEVVALLAASNHCAPAILREIGRTPAMKQRFISLGYCGIDDEPWRSRGYRYRARPTHVRRVIGQFGLEPPQRKKRQPQRLAAPAVARIGRRRRDGQDLKLYRSALFEKVWSVPVETLAAEWGLSGPGLKKACNRLAVPVPPRGHWARVRAGQRPHRPRLPAAPPGTPSTLVVSVLSAEPPE